MIRSTSVRWGRRAAFTLLLAVVAGLEIGALSTPVVRDLRVGILGERSARDVAVVLDVLLVLPLLLVALGLTWNRPRWLATRLAPVIAFVKPWLRWALGLPLALLLLNQLLPGTNLVFILVLIEAALLIFLAFRLVRLYALVREQRREGYSLVTAVIVAATRSFGTAPIVPVLRLALLELGLLGYSLFGWFRRPPVRARAFSNHRRDDDTVMIALVMLIVLETVPVHVLLHPYSPVLAWVLLLLNLYSLMWLLGDIAARRNRPVLLFNDRLRLVRGLRTEAVIRLPDVLRVEAGGEEAELSVGPEPRFVFRLREPLKVYGWFGALREVKSVAVGVDEPVEFLNTLALAGVPVAESDWQSPAQR